MAKQHHSALHDLFVSIRRVIVLLVAAFALAMEWPAFVVVSRVAILWAILVVLSHAGEILFQYLSQRALEQQNNLVTDETGGAARS